MITLSTGRYPDSTNISSTSVFSNIPPKSPKEAVEGDSASITVVSTTKGLRLASGTLVKVPVAGIGGKEIGFSTENPGNDPKVGEEGKLVGKLFIEGEGGIVLKAAKEDLILASGVPGNVDGNGEGGIALKEAKDDLILASALFIAGLGGTCTGATESNDTGSGEGGIALKEAKDDLILASALETIGLGGAPKLIKGKLFPFVEGRGDNTGDNVEVPRVDKFRDNDGVAIGLGVELNDLPLKGFKSPEVDVVSLGFGLSGTKTDVRCIDILLNAINT